MTLLVPRQQVLVLAITVVLVEAGSLNVLVGVCELEERGLHQSPSLHQPFHIRPEEDKYGLTSVISSVLFSETISRAWHDHRTLPATKNEGASSSCSWDVLCLGLGSPSESPNANAQLAFMLEICQDLSIVGSHTLRNTHDVHYCPLLNATAYRTHGNVACP